MQYNNTQKRVTVFGSATRPGYDYKCVLFLYGVTLDGKFKSLQVSGQSVITIT